MARLRTTEHAWGTLVELTAPEVYNALDLETVEALTEVFCRPGAGAVVLAAEGEHFCAGGDVGAMAAATQAAELESLLEVGGRAFGALVAAIVSCPAPVVAAIQGAAVGGGLSLALACDVRIAGPSTQLVPAWGRWALPPDGGATALLAQVVGPAAAASLLIRGEPLDTWSPWASAAFTDVVDDERIREVAVATAERLAVSPGARAAKAATRPLVLPQLCAQLDVEQAALMAAARDPAVLALLSGGLRDSV
jgi:enoyl-CoA hydratase/carnithine racemase